MNQAFSIAQRFDIKNRAGLKFSLTRLNPAHKGRIAFALHGHSGSSTEPHIQMVANELVDSGHSVVLIDATHSLNGSDGDLEHGNLNTYLKDLEDAVDFARSEGWMKRHWQITLAAHSMGGCAAMFYAAAHAEQVRNLILISPAIAGKLVEQGFADNAPAYYEDWKKQGKVTITNPYSRDAQDNPRTDTRSFDWLQRERSDIRPFSHLLTMPKLIVVGTKDTPTPPHDQHKFTKLLPGDKEYREVQGAGHTYNSDDHRKALAQHVRNWLKSHP